MNNHSRKSMIVRCIIAACLSLIMTVVMVVMNFSELGATALLMGLFALIVFFIEFFGICIEPLMYFRLVKDAFTNVGIAAFVSVFWGILMIFIGMIIFTFKSFFLGIKGVIYLIKSR